MLIEFRNISKVCGTVRALDQVSFSIQKSQIHAIVGENGAGKSTLMKILFGLYQADQGEVIFSDPACAQRLGMVHQHFMLAGPITALDHVLMEKKNISLFQLLDRKKTLSELEKISADLQMPVPWTQFVEELPVGIQQRIEILKLLYFNSEILILDEPTAVLTPQDVDEFLKRLQQLKTQGKTIILITHKLKEVFAVADSVTILRHGKVAGHGPISKWTAQSLGETMVGEPVKASHYVERPADFNAAKTLEIKNLYGRLNLSIEKGEIVGLAGIEGNGQSELIQALLSPKTLRETPEGLCQLNGKNLLDQSNQSIRHMGVGYLAEDRHSKGVLLDSNLSENFILGTQDLWTKKGILQFKAIRQGLRQAIEKFEIKVQSLEQKISSLSGGNQQKLVIARELIRPLKFLVAAQPTRGVDIGAIEKIHQTLWDLRKNGTSILLISSELEELMKLSDRILVIFRGEILAEFDRSAGFDEKKIGAVMGGVQP